MLLGMGQETFSTVLVAFALSTICVGFFFYILGYYELGNAVYFFPRHIVLRAKATKTVEKVSWPIPKSMIKNVQFK